MNLWALDIGRTTTLEYFGNKMYHFYSDENV